MTLFDALFLDTTVKRTPRRIPWHIVVFLAPAFIIYTSFMIFPLFDSLRVSLQVPIAENSDALSADAYTFGLGNYRTLFSDSQWAPRLLNALRNNVLFFAVHMLVQNPVGLLLAVLLASRLVVGRAVYRTLLFTPTVLSIVLVGFIWRLILSPLWGISEDILGFVGLAGQNRPWLGLEQTALVTLSLVSVWQYVGIPMLLFSAALVGIPDMYLEAAKVDGASSWAVFWRIQFPLLLPTVGIVSVLRLWATLTRLTLSTLRKKPSLARIFRLISWGRFSFAPFLGCSCNQVTPPWGRPLLG